jgi:hypothetical protein
MVSISGGSPSFPRRYETYRSTTFRLAAAGLPHTRSSASSRVTTRRRLSRSSSSRSASLALRPRSGAGRGARADVEDELAVGDQLVGLVPTAQKCPDAREQLVGCERLDEIVIGPGVEPGDPVRDAVSRRQHQDRHREPLLPQPPRDRQPVEPRHRHVEDDEVRSRSLHRRHGTPAVRRRRDRVPLRGKRPLQHPPDRGVVVDDEDRDRSHVLRVALRFVY